MLKRILVKVYFALARRALRMSNSQEGRHKLIRQLTDIVPDLSTQYSTWDVGSADSFDQEKLRSIHAFQVSLVLRTVLEEITHSGKQNISIGDIGDSAGTHSSYLEYLLHDAGVELTALSVNIDPTAVEKIQRQGGRAILAKAEDVSQLLKGDEKIDIFLSFQMLEHLLNPALFMHDIATKTDTDWFIITVPYVKRSRVGLKYIREPRFTRKFKAINAENTHIFELSPDDWKMLLRFSGWEVVREDRFLMYPRGSWLTPFKFALRRYDFEGFLGLILKRNLKDAQVYESW